MATSFLQSGRLWEGSSLAVIKASFDEAMSQAEDERKADAQARLDVYEDDYRERLRERITATFSKANAEELCKVLDSTNNPLKRIVNEISTLYTKAPVWGFADLSTGETWRAILKKARASVVFPKLNRMVTLLNTALVYVRPSRDGLVFKLVLPQHATVWADPDRPEMPFAVMFQETNASTPGAKPVHHMWDRRPDSAGYRKFNADGKCIEDLPNPYTDEHGEPIIPLVAYHRSEPSSGFWDETTGDDLYELTVMLGMWETWINHLQRTDSTRQKYATGSLDASGAQEGGPLGILTLRAPDGVPVTVGEFSSQSDWDGMGNQLKRKYENVTNGYGLLSPENKSSGDPTSGFALRVRKEGLSDLREQQIPIYESSDLALYEVVASVWNFELTNPAFPLLVGEPLPPPSVAKPTITYAAFQTSQTVEEQAAVFELAKARMGIGLESPITIYMKEHPGATEDEARAAIEKNKADAKALAPAQAPPPPFGGRPPFLPQPDAGEAPAPADEETPAEE